MPFLESPDNLPRPLRDIDSTIEKHFTPGIRKREDMYLARGMACFEGAFDNRIDLPILSRMKPAPDPRDTTRSSVDDPKRKFPARSGTV